MFRPMLFTATLVATLTVLAGGVREARAGARLAAVANCPTQYNWCAPSQGGSLNCFDCCQLSHYSNSFCISEDETTQQDCLCF